MNIIGIVLEIVIHASGQRVHTIRDHIIDLDLQLVLSQIQMEAVTQRARYAGATLLEARQIAAELHDFNDRHQLVHVLSGRQEAAQHQDLEVSEHVTLLSAHHLHKLARHFEGRALKAQVLRRTGQHEAVIDVYQMALIVQQYISIVSVFDLRGHNRYITYLILGIGKDKLTLLPSKVSLNVALLFCF